LIPACWLFLLGATLSCNVVRPARNANGKKKQRPKVACVRGDGVDLVGRVVAVEQSLARSPAPAAADNQHVADERRPLALHSHKLRP
jgi:hypothetical protein